jgi:L-alanine-DL-glutamate epimerase-like enolase superfamily enzyme
MPFTLLGDTMLCHLGSIIKDHYPLDGEGHTYFSDTPFHGGVEIRNGQALLNQDPGFGISIYEDKLAAMAAFSE